MAEVQGISVKLSADIRQLIKALEEAKKALGSVAQESQKQADSIGNPLKNAADQIGSKYGWLAGELATKLASMVNPATIAAAAITAAFAGVTAYINSLADKMPNTDDVLRSHTKLIKDIKSAYEVASEGVKQYGLDTEDVLVARNRANIILLQDQVKKLSADVVAAFTGAAPATSQWSRSLDLAVGAITLSRRELIPFGDALNNLNNGVKSGTPDIARFRSEISAIMSAAANNVELQKLGNQLLQVSEEALNATGKLSEAKDEINGVAGAARSAAVATDSFNNAMKTLQGIEPARIDDMTRASNAFNEAIKNQNLSAQQRIDLENQYAAAQKRVQDAAKKALDDDARRAAEAAAREAERQKQKQEDEKFYAKSSLENLELSWGTREEKLAAHLVREQEIIAHALANKVIQDDEHKALMEAAEDQHQKRLQALRDRTNTQALRSTASMFGSLQSLTESFGKKNTALSKAFGISQALINTYVGVTQALRTLPPPASYAAAAATLAQGLAQVASIRSVSDTGKGGGGASSSSGAMTSAANSSSGGGQTGGNSVYVNLQGQTFGRDQVRDLVKQIADFQADGGQVVFA